jgi:hypothetical protein
LPPLLLLLAPFPFRDGLALTTATPFPKRRRMLTRKGNFMVDCRYSQLESNLVSLFERFD